MGATTGAAALPVLYSFRRCPYAMRARLALAVSGFAHEHREVVLRDKPAELLVASPKGTVPVLVLPNGHVIDQSLDIMRHALALRDPAHWLPADPAVLDDMLALIAHNDGPFKRQLDRYKYPHRHPDESAGDTAAFALRQRDGAAPWLAGLDARLASPRSAASSPTVSTVSSDPEAPRWLYGGSPSLADMAVLPFVRQFAHTDKAWFAAQAWPHLQAWLTAFEASDLYLGVMGKHDAWRPDAA